MRSTADDLSTRSRIRDTAVLRFARDGFGASLRAIASDAGVSAALIVHHFGSKDGLRAACDAHVLADIRAANTETGGGTAGMLERMAAAGEHAGPIAYLLQTFRAGGPGAEAFLAHLIADARAALDAGVAAGTMKPSRDPDARAWFVTHSSIGGLLAYAATAGIADPVELVRSYQARAALPALEIYAEGLLADPGLLSAYLTSQEEGSA